MRWRIRDVLLVSSLYDSYIFEEDGRLYEQIRSEYQGLSLSHSPELTRVSSGTEAIARAKEENRFDLIMTTLHIEDMHPLEFAKEARDAGLTTPIILLAFDNRELADLVARHDTSIFNRIFIWQGDFRLLTAIIKHLEDRNNVEHDAASFGVQSIILIEDNIRFYSSFLPLIYTELLNQSQRLISEGVNLSHRSLRMRARPKILLSTNYEEGWEYFQKYRYNILGIISDVDFQRDGRQDAQAGLEFARSVKREMSDIPILLQSYLVENQSKALALGASFVLKDSPTLLNEVRQFMLNNFGFGDFVFRTPNGEEVGHARDLRSLESLLHTVPAESIRFHGERNHFSNWLKARTEFWLAHQLRPRKVSDFSSLDELRKRLIVSLHAYRQMQQRGLVADFTKESFDPASSLARIGGGSLGGKARGLGFLNMLINTHGVREKFNGVHVFVPAGVVVGTDVFDEFLEKNTLSSFALSETDDEAITLRFLEAKKFPRRVEKDLAAFLDIVREPLAVRSSSLLEDSQYQPFAGVYETYMLPNNHPNPRFRFRELVNAIKRVYASIFYQKAKDYIKMTSYRLEEEKMAVIVQKMVGARHGDRFYPEIAGVAKSYNFYPLPSQLSSDGTVSVALGLGKLVVDGGPAVRFSPKDPTHLQQFSSVDDTLANNQHEFYALDMSGQSVNGNETHDVLTKKFPLDVAENDGTLRHVGSTYSPENDAVYDGLSRPGMRLVTFSPILKGKLLPLPEILTLLLHLGSGGMGTAVEIEFAVDMSVPDGMPKEFCVLQIRPLVINREFEELSLEKFDKERLLCQSDQVLGNGAIIDIKDMIVVDIHRFDRSKSHDVAGEVGQFNAQLVARGRPYLLIGVGRWGTLDPWLGIPVRWDQISGAKAIVETGFKDFIVTPSQGSHFFQNITAFMVGYFTVNPLHGEGSLDWEWLSQCDAVEEKIYTRHLQLTAPLLIRMNGHEHKGIILKPEGGN
ncbi:MAG: histidine kinase [Ignavibacteriae bacterium]|nr:histidine kinase [Ignavibacteria bacterium]MBI3364985.1 histidine kinase [Ignavibacteriota bacterium]